MESQLQHKPAIQDFIKELSTHFKLRDLGSTTQLLGFKVERDRPSRTISLSQRQYILDMLEKYGMSNCKPVSVEVDVSASHVIRSCDCGNFHSSI